MQLADAGAAGAAGGPQCDGHPGQMAFAPFYDVFVGLEDINDRQFWIYKPWVGFSRIPRAMRCPR